jgi:hypothetical protein
MCKRLLLTGAMTVLTSACGYGRQLFSARGAVLSICGYCARGRLEIDWLALVRQFQAPSL